MAGWAKRRRSGWIIVHRLIHTVVTKVSKPSFCLWSCVGRHGVRCRGGRGSRKAKGQGGHGKAGERERWGRRERWRKREGERAERVAWACVCMSCHGNWRWPSQHCPNGESFVGMEVQGWRRGMGWAASSGTRDGCRFARAGHVPGAWLLSRTRGGEAGCEGFCRCARICTWAQDSTPSVMHVAPPPPPIRETRGRAHGPEET